MLHYALCIMQCKTAFYDVSKMKGAAEISEK